MLYINTIDSKEANNKMWNRLIGGCEVRLS